MALVSPSFEFCVQLYSSNLVAAIKHLERIQWLATMLANGLCHLPYEERLQRPVLHPLQAAAISGRPDNRIPIISTGQFDADPSLFLYLPLDAA